MENQKVLATLNKIIYDVLTILSTDDKKDEPFEIGVRCKTEEVQNKLFKMLCAIFEDFKNLNVVKDSDELKVYVERKEKKKRSNSCTEELEDLKIN
jgi:hypothetical protein